MQLLIANGDCPGLVSSGRTGFSQICSCQSGNGFSAGNRNNLSTKGSNQQKSIGISSQLSEFLMGSPKKIPTDVRLKAASGHLVEDPNSYRTFVLPNLTTVFAKSRE
jgi:hypothetical protein